MYIRAVSDLHLEFCYGNMRLNELPTDKDTVLILAGDVGLVNKPHTFLPFFEDKAKRFKYVLYVMGNHEHYKGSYTTTYGRLNDALVDFDNVYILEREDFTLDNVTFIGSTLWADMDSNNELCMTEAKFRMHDYETIRNGPPAEPWKRKLSPVDTVATHLRSKEYIFPTIKEYKDMGNKVVVISHHAPSYKSVPEEFKGDSINGAYVTELDELIMDTKPDLWIHGHTHNSFDYNIEDTRVICNPRGYWTMSGNYLNHDFNEELLLEV